MFKSPGYLFHQEKWLKKISSLFGCSCWSEDIFPFSLFAVALSAQPILPLAYVQREMSWLKSSTLGNRGGSVCTGKIIQVYNKSLFNSSLWEKHHCLFRLEGPAFSASSSTMLSFWTAVRWRGSLSWPAYSSPPALAEEEVRRHSRLFTPSPPTRRSKLKADGSSAIRSECRLDLNLAGDHPRTYTFLVGKAFYGLLFIVGDTVTKQRLPRWRAADKVICRMNINIVIVFGFMSVYPFYGRNVAITRKLDWSECA